MVRRVSRPAAAALLSLAFGCQPATSPSEQAETPAFSASASTMVLSIPSDTRIGPGTRAAIEACLGEPVTFVGDGVLIVHQTTLPDGSATFVVRASPQGSVGVGALTGTIYRLAASDGFTDVVGASGSFTSTFTGNLHVVGPGQSPGFFGHILLHVTVTPTGEVTAEAELVDIHCA